MSKPKVLVLGGVGFIGRNLVHYIVSNDLASYVRVCDKVLPATAFLGSPHKEAFDNAVVEFKQCNLASKAGVEKAFQLDDGKFSYVFNCAAETKYGQTEEVYKEKVLDLSVTVGKAAAAHGVEKFVEFSTAQVYDADKKPSPENGKLKPWTNQAKYKLQAEEELKKISGLNLVILRPAIVYGRGDTNGLAPRIITAAVYTHLGEKMEFLWAGSLRLNTVHVDDVCTATWLAATKASAGTIYNLADKGDTTQETVSKILEKIFRIKTGFMGNLKSKGVSAVGMSRVTEFVNDKHLKPWSDLCKDAGILNTPLTPYLDQELLYQNALSVDGSSVESLGFKYSHPEVTEALIKEEIDYFVKQNLFPSTVLP